MSKEGFRRKYSNPAGEIGLPEEQFLPCSNQERLIRSELDLARHDGMEGIRFRKISSSIVTSIGRVDVLVWQ